MKAFHNSRDPEYRSPAGPARVGQPVAFALDVLGAPQPRAWLRTWIDGRGEARLPMQAHPRQDGTVRFEAELVPDAAGIIWYQFVVEAPGGQSRRYGMPDERQGGAGRLFDWEPASFRLTVLEQDAQPTCDAPLAAALARFVRGEASACEFAERVEDLRERLPAASYAQALESLARSHDAELFAAIAQPMPGGGATPDAASLGRAKGRFWCACLVKELLAAGLAPIWPAPGEGLAGDPWDADCDAIVANARNLRRTVPLFAGGTARCFAQGDDVLGIWRAAEPGQAVCVLVNRSLEHAHEVAVPYVAENVSEVISGYGVATSDATPGNPHDDPDAPEAAAWLAWESMPSSCKRPGRAARAVRQHLHQLGSAVLFFHPEHRLASPLGPGIGLLAHLTSVPASADAPTGTPGTLGKPAHEFVDWLADAGVRYWQVLPTNPTDEHGSPYAGISAFAGNALLLEPGTDPDALASAREPQYRQFCEREAGWLEPYAAFQALRGRFGGERSWQQWPERYRAYDPRNIDADDGLRDAAERWRRTQFAFDVQWRELREHAAKRGVLIIGDMPLYVSADSADAWAHPGIFQLDGRGHPTVVAGCPPDGFAAEGQVWGNPVYDWDALERDGYTWWLRRLQRAFELCDFVRIDHFIGFARYFCIPAGGTALEGCYRPGPGLRFFQAACRVFGPLPLIAEDLGSITPAVRALGAACGFPGMDVIQFADGNDPLSGYRPRPGKIAYTGTHDNQTLVGYAQTRYPEADARRTAAELARMVMESDAPVRVIALQDALGLGDEARMNTPGTVEGNWNWQAERRIYESPLRLP